MSNTGSEFRIRSKASNHQDTLEYQDMDFSSDLVIRPEVEIPPTVTCSPSSVSAVP